MGVNRRVFSILFSVCDDGWDLQTIGENSYCYKYAGQLTRARGVDFCEANDSAFPLPKDSQENKDLFDYGVSLGFRTFWLDASDEAEEGNWVDSAGNPLTFTAWAPNEPNGSRGENYLHYWVGELWNDRGGTGTDHVLCQKNSA